MISLSRPMVLAMLAATCLWGSAAAQDATSPVDPLSDLKRKAEAVLALPNVMARTQVDEVFDYADALIEAGRDAEAEEMLVAGLRHHPWDLDFQLKLARLLDKRGAKDQALDKARLVATRSEKQDQIDAANAMLAIEPAEPFPDVRRLDGADHRFVLVPLQDAEPWLMLRLRDGLAAELGIPVEIQRIDAAYPPPARDDYGLMVREARYTLEKNIKAPVVLEAMKSLGRSEADLKSDAKVMELLATVIARQQGTEAAREFEDRARRGVGRRPQWNADELQAALDAKIDPHRRANVGYLGITPRDIFARDYNFLFGWAGKRGGVMSYRRFTAEFSDAPPNQERLVKRALAQCLASSGHIFDVDECTDPTCARAYPETLDEHDAKEAKLCGECAARFKKLFEQGTPAADPPPTAP